MPNPLTRQVGLRVGPIVLETLVNHYIEKLTKDFVQQDGRANDDDRVQLRKDELLYDEIFAVVKAFLEAASFHSVEDVQSFSNTRTPSPPWVHVVRVRVPMSSCDEAAKYLITALGGEEVAQKVVGGIKWWQVRSIEGVDAQWITAKKDWQEAKRRFKEREKTQREESFTDQFENATYNEDMDAMRCILYAHGGGYYFGSVDQERYSIQRYARKINGRVFAINYRLAPQYPFPCAIQDLLAAYLYLIQPPSDASHMPVKPSHIVVAGDSAGGGLTLALLQVLRDSSLPLPAGGILISPWCDLTHSFPSIHTNTASDVIPPYGLSLQKPSTLWPPPDEELADRVRMGLTKRVRAVFKGEGGDPNASVVSLGLSVLDSRTATDASATQGAGPSNGMPVDVGATTPLPLPTSEHDGNANPFDSQSIRESITLQAQNGEILTIKQQIQLYTTNVLLGHPLVSPALGYLGGLPPLMVIASDREVLRDEIIYMAHKAAYPEQFPIRDTTRALYPALNGIEERYQGKPTPVHLQVYDDTAHVLPVLFSFTTPAKYCFRAMAIFCKYVTGMNLFPHDTNNADSQPNENPSPNSTGDALTGIFSSISSTISSSLSPGGGNDEVDSGASKVTSPVSPRSTRSIRSLAGSGSGLFTRSGLSVRRSRRTHASDSGSELERSVSERRGSSRFSLSPIGREKRSARSVSASRTEGIESEHSGSISTIESRMPEGLSSDKIQEGVKGSDSTPKKREKGVSPVPPLSLSSAPTTPAKPSPLLVSDRMVDVPHLTASPTTSPLPSPSASSTFIPISETTIEELPTSAPAAFSTLHPPSPATTPRKSSRDTSDLARAPEKEMRYAGDPVVYSETADFPSLHTSLMIRERVSTAGIIRPLEPPSSLDALNIPFQLIGEISERAVRRYIEGRALFDSKFARTIKAIDKRRKKHLKRARKDTIKNMNALKGSVERELEKVKEEDGDDENSKPPESPHAAPFSIQTALLASSGWSWSWALDHNERPPPSSLVARRDTHEALMLARVADQAVLQDEKGMSGNNLWRLVVGFLTPIGERDKTKRGDEHGSSPGKASGKPKNGASSSSFSPSKLGIGKFRSKFASIGGGGAVEK